MHVGRWTRIRFLFLFMVVIAGLPIAGSAHAQIDSLAQWRPGKQWVSIRVGFSKSTVHGAGYGGAGYGFGYSRMLKPWKIYKWTVMDQHSIGVYVHHEVVGHFGSAAEIEVPATVELVRHFLWGTPARPYLGVGGGAFIHKLYRTGADNRDINFAPYLAIGINSPINQKHMVGLDARWIREDVTNDPADPVFGVGSGALRSRTNGTTYIVRKRGSHWSLKANYTLTY